VKVTLKLVENAANKKKYTDKVDMDFNINE